MLGEPDDPLHRRVRVVLLTELGRGFERLVQPDPELVRDRLGDAVDLAVTVAKHPPDVADRGAGEHRAERDDLGDAVLAVLRGHVGDDLVAPVVLEVDVDVGHRHPVGVEEALERQPVVNRIDRRDPERVGDDRTRRRAAARRLDPLLAGVAHEVGDDQEVARVAHRGDHAQLVVEPLLELRGHAAVAALEPALAFRPKPALDRLAVGHREMRDPQLAQRKREIRHLGDSTRVRDRLRMVREERRHLGRALDVELGRLEAHPVRRVEVVARPHAQQHVVRLGLVAPHVVQVVRRDERQTDLRGEPEELLVEPPLLGQAVVLELEEEPVRTEDVAVLAGQLASELPVLDFERPRDLAVEAGRQADQAFAVPGEVLAVDARLVVVAVDVRVRDEPTQVQVAGPVLREQDQVERLGVGLALLVGHRAPRDVRLHADDRLDVPGAAGLVERDRAVQRAVVGQRERIEALLGRRIDQLGDPAEAVEQAEFGVDVEVGEVVRGDGHAAVHGSQTGDYHAPMLDVTTTREAVQTLDGRSLDLYLGGPADGDALLFHIGTPSAPVPYEPAIRAMAERGLRYVAFSRPGTARRRGARAAPSGTWPKTSRRSLTMSAPTPR